MLQGLADTFIILGMAFDSPEAKQLNKDIFECIYYHALVTSCELAKVEGNKPKLLLATCCCFCQHTRIGVCVRAVLLCSIA